MSLSAGAVQNDQTEREQCVMTNFCSLKEKHKWAYQDIKIKKQTLKLSFAGLKIS